MTVLRWQSSIRWFRNHNSGGPAEPAFVGCEDATVEQYYREIDDGDYEGPNEGLCEEDLE